MTRRSVLVPGRLVLADGEVFEGEVFDGGGSGQGKGADEAVGPASGEGAASVTAIGEVVFNTALSGYQEIITDPSYAGQIIAFTYPHIGNYGVTAADNESRRAYCRGVIVRDLARLPSSWRSEDDLPAFLAGNGIPVITGIDTRRLTRHLRRAGAMPGAFGLAAVEELLAAAVREPGTDGKDLVSDVTTSAPFSPEVGGEAPSASTGSRRSDSRSVVAFDFGIKTSILRQLSRVAQVTVVPASTSAESVLRYRPDGVFLSNGPGDPAALPWAVRTVEDLLGRVPIFGICLGHQILAEALGARTYKLPFGHHGANHPVRNVESNRIEITSQNHNYAVDGDLPDAIAVTHVNLNDGVVEGIRSTRVPAFGVQYHPEAGPGPHDARYLFEEFARVIDAFEERG